MQRTAAAAAAKWVPTQHLQTREVGVGVAVNELEANEQMMKRCEKVGSFATVEREVRARGECRVYANFSMIV